jgi:hypothetical protein
MTYVWKILVQDNVQQDEIVKVQEGVQQRSVTCARQRAKKRISDVA